MGPAQSPVAARLGCVRSPGLGRLYPDQKGVTEIGLVAGLPACWTCGGPLESSSLTTGIVAVARDRDPGLDATPGW